MTASGYLLDTNILTELMKTHGNEGVLEFVNKLHPFDIYVSVISLGEIVYGISRIPDGRRKRDLEIRFDQLEIDEMGGFVPVDSEIVIRLANMRAKFNTWHSIGYADGLIAATAAEHDLNLVSRDRDFVPLNIALTNPWSDH